MESEKEDAIHVANLENDVSQIEKMDDGQGCSDKDRNLKEQPMEAPKLDSDEKLIVQPTEDLPVTDPVCSQENSTEEQASIMDSSDLTEKRDESEKAKETVPEVSAATTNALVKDLSSQEDSPGEQPSPTDSQSNDTNVNDTKEKSEKNNENKEILKEVKASVEQVDVVIRDVNKDTEKIDDNKKPESNKLYRDENDGYDSDSSASVSSDDSSVVLSSDSEEAPSEDVPIKAEEKTITKKKKKNKNKDVFEVDIKTKGEILLDDLPPIEELKIDVDDSVSLLELGSINSIIGPVVIVQANRGVPAVDQDTVVFTEDRLPLGQVFETFGPVPQPLYVVRFNSAEDVAKRGLQIGQTVVYAPNLADYTHFVFVEQLRAMRGSDASWEHNNEPPDKYLEFSDDDEERRFRAKGRSHNGEDGQDGDEKTETKRRKKNRQRHQARVDGDHRSPAGPGGHGPSQDRPSAGPEWMGGTCWPPRGGHSSYRPMTGPHNGGHPWNGPPGPQMGPGGMPRGVGRPCWEPSPVFGQSQVWGQAPPPPPHPNMWNANHPSQNMPMDYRYVQTGPDNFQPHMARPPQPGPRGPGPRAPQFCRMPMPPSQFGGGPSFPRGPPGWNS